MQVHLFHVAKDGNKALDPCSKAVITTNTVGNNFRVGTSFHQCWWFLMIVLLAWEALKDAGIGSASDLLSHQLVEEVFDNVD
jgi:hypothetical protein